MKQIYFIAPRNLVLLFFVLATFQISAQTVILQAPKPAGNPNQGSSAWFQICAGNNGGFNQYYATVNWAGNPNSGNEWILELSDASGSFANPTELARESNNAIVQSPGFEFAIPTDARGSGYKFRVRGTDPSVTGPATSSSYSIYYMDFTSNLLISQDGNGVLTSNICTPNNSVRLEVHNVSSPETYQYKWYRSGSPLTDTTYYIDATIDGIYQVFIDYGECTGSGTTNSNTPSVTLNSTGQGIGITPPSKTALCSGDVEPLSIDMIDGSWSYQWYKDGTSISGATFPTYNVDAGQTNFEGDYQVEISAIGICTERSAPVAITNAGLFSVTLNNSPNIVLLPSQTKNLSVTTDANTPSYEWFKDGVAISGSNSPSINIDQPGIYYGEVTQTGGTCAIATVKSESTVVVEPTSFKLDIAYATAYTACSSSSIVLEVNKISAVLADLSEIDVTTDVAGSFSYQWQRDGLNIAGETAQNISLTDSNENGDYILDGTFGGINVDSNTLAVQLGSNETLSIASTSTVYCNSSDTITLSTSTDLIGENFAWEKDGASINTTDSSLTVSEPGAYRLTINKGICPLRSNEILISPLDPDLITLDTDGNVIFPEGSSKTVNASGGTQYRWFDAANNEISTSSSVTFTEEGNYLLIANIDNCEISKSVTVTYLDLFNIPNVITPNGDGANDQWIIPNSYSKKSDVNVIIYNAKGIEVFNVMGYQNNWPESSMSFPKQNMVFYYVVKNAKETLKQGTITVIR